MSEQQGRAPEAVDQATTESSTEQFWSAIGVGSLFVTAGAISPAVHALSGEWPAGYGGMVAAAFVVVGIFLFGYSLAVGS
ncbi:hypothetical protein [Halosimplex sp. J119]